MQYIEDIPESKAYKEEYLSGIAELIVELEKDAVERRNRFFEDFFCNQEKKREEFKKMLGWPLVGDVDFVMPEPEAIVLFENDELTIYRMRFEFLKGVKLTGIFIKKNDDQKRPLVIAQHGGDGTPELISGFEGCTHNYNNMVKYLLDNGANVFAPQLLLWRKEKYELEYDRYAIDAKLKRLGSSITALEIYAITKVLDFFDGKLYVKNFGMVGLSYGGFYTLFTQAVDTRIKSGISCSFFNDRSKYAWANWTWNDSAYTFSDAEIACLVYPRKLYIAIGDEDALFNYKTGIEEFKRLESLCEDVGTEWVEFRVFSGYHEYLKDDEFTKKLINDIIKKSEGRG